MDIKDFRDAQGKLIFYVRTDSVYYLDSHGSILCPDCANEREENQKTDAIIVSTIISGNVNYKDQNLWCYQCSNQIQASYDYDDDEEAIASEFEPA